MKPAMPVEAADIVVSGVNDFLDAGICQNAAEGREVIDRYRIDEVDFAAGGDLNQAKLLGVMVEAVGFRIQGDGS